jgi:outer membrane protein TolC
VEIANLEIEQQNLEVELFKLKERINQLYFSILLLDENGKILDLHKGTLNDRLAQVESGVRNGTVLASNADILKAEILKLEQSIEEVRIAREAAISIMEEYTALQLDEQTDFLLPEAQVNPGSYQNNRPEYALFGMQQRKLEASKHLAGSRNLPRLSAFGQAGYGRPGYDMLKNEFDDFYMVGARLTWNFWDWNKVRKEKEILDVQHDIISTRQETFDKHVRIDLENKLAGIRKAEKLLEQDDEIILLREKITASAAAQLEHGAITSTEYVTELNAESKARLDREAHRIELVKAKLDYQSTLGNL